MHKLRLFLKIIKTLYVSSNKCECRINNILSEKINRTIMNYNQIDGSNSIHVNDLLPYQIKKLIKFLNDLNEEEEIYKQIIGHNDRAMKMMADVTKSGHKIYDSVCSKYGLELCNDNVKLLSGVWICQNCEMPLTYHYEYYD